MPERSAVLRARPTFRYVHHTPAASALSLSGQADIVVVGPSRVRIATNAWGGCHFRRRTSGVPDRERFGLVTAAAAPIYT